MAMNGKNKLINTAHFYERSALEISDAVPQAFPYRRGKPFENSPPCLASLDYWYKKERMYSPSQCSKHILLYFPLPEQWTSALVGEPHEKWSLLASPREPEDTSTQGNLSVVWKGSCLLPIWKTSISSPYLRLSGCFGNRKGLTEIDFLTVLASVGFIEVWGLEYIDHVACGDYFKSFLSCFLPPIAQNCPPVGKLPKLLRKAK